MNALNFNYTFFEVNVRTTASDDSVQDVLIMSKTILSFN